jgi:hypothetical protein
LAWAAAAASPKLEVVAEEPVTVFGGGKRTVRIQLRNPTAASIEATLRWRLFQATSSTLAPTGDERPWHAVSLRPSQALLENLEVELPEVRAASLFHIVWYEGNDKIGATLLRVFPENLLRRLTTLAGDAPVGLVDPEGRFTNALGSLRYESLSEAEQVAATDARLILIAPFGPAHHVAGLAKALKAKAASGAAVVWAQPPNPRSAELLPSTYLLEAGDSRVVITSAQTLSDLADSPRAQIHLLRLAELATGKATLAWPGDTAP